MFVAYLSVGFVFQMMMQSSNCSHGSEEGWRDVCFKITERHRAGSRAGPMHELPKPNLTLQSTKLRVSWDRIDHFHFEAPGRTVISRGGMLADDESRRETSRSPRCRGLRCTECHAGERRAGDSTWPGAAGGNSKYMYASCPKKGRSYAGHASFRHA